MVSPVLLYKTLLLSDSAGVSTKQSLVTMAWQEVDDGLSPRCLRKPPWFRLGRDCKKMSTFPPFKPPLALTDSSTLSKELMPDMCVLDSIHTSVHSSELCDTSLLLRAPESARATSQAQWKPPWLFTVTRPLTSSKRTAGELCKVSHEQLYEYKTLKSDSAMLSTKQSLVTMAWEEVDDGSSPLCLSKPPWFSYRMFDWRILKDKRMTGPWWRRECSSARG